MTPRLRLLHIYQSPSFSGAEAYALEVALYHSKTHDVTFLARADSPLLKKANEKSAEAASNMQTSTALSSLDLSNFDLVILHSTQELKHHWPRLAWNKVKAKLRGSRGARIALYTHIWISHSKKDPLHAIPYAVVDRVWCASRQAQRALENFLPIGAEKIEVVRYGRDTDTFDSMLLTKSEAREKLKVPKDAIVVGTLARVDHGKGSRELYEAVTKLMPLMPKLHLLMIGPPTDGDPKAAALDRQLNLEIENQTADLRHRIHKIGRLEGGTYYLSAFDLFILATYKENFALTLLEAQCAEIPCLATNSGGSPDVIHLGTTGWLFEPESVPALRVALESALSQQNTWQQLGTAGRRQVLEKYKFNEVMKDLDRKIETLAL